MQVNLKSLIISYQVLYTQPDITYFFKKWTETKTILVDSRIATHYDLQWFGGAYILVRVLLSVLCNYAIWVEKTVKHSAVF